MICMARLYFFPNHIIIMPHRMRYFVLYWDLIEFVCIWNQIEEYIALQISLNRSRVDASRNRTGTDLVLLSHDEETQLLTFDLVFNNGKACVGLECPISSGIVRVSALPYTVYDFNMAARVKVRNADGSLSDVTFYADPAFLQIQPCNKGEELTQDLHCEICDAGKFIPSVPLKPTSCSKCPVGTYNPDFGSHECYKCDGCLTLISTNHTLTTH